MIDQRNIPSFMSNDADFRAWGGGIAAALQACGLVKAGDTGQINWATVIRPAAINTFAGYEIYRFNDALQATKPVFIKVEYGVSNALTIPQLAVTVGTETNGAGTLTSPSVGARKLLQPGAATVAGRTGPMFTSGAAGRIALYYLDTFVASHFVGFAVERLKDENGAVTGEAAYTYMWHGNSSSQYQLILWGGVTSPAAITPPPALGMQDAGLANVGSDLAVSPHMPCYGKWRYAWLLTYRRTDLADLVPINFVHLGAAHTFLPLAHTKSDHAQMTNSVYCLMIPWE